MCTFIHLKDSKHAKEKKTDRQPEIMSSIHQ